MQIFGINAFNRAKEQAVSLWFQYIRIMKMQKKLICLHYESLTRQSNVGNRPFFFFFLVVKQIDQRPRLEVCEGLLQTSQGYLASHCTGKSVKGHLIGGHQNLGLLL